MKPVQHTIMNYLLRGGWKSTREIHQHLGSKISRRRLLRILNRITECGCIVHIGGTKQKIWRYEG